MSSTGEATDNATQFARWLKEGKSDLEPDVLKALQYTVFGLGDVMMILMMRMMMIMMTMMMLEEVEMMMIMTIMMIVA